MKNGVVTGKSFGSGLVEVDLANGDTIYYRISVGFNVISMETPHYEYSIMAEPVIPGSRTTLIPVARAIYSIV